VRSTLGLGALAVLATVGTSQIDANAVTNAKLAQMADQRLKGNVSGGTADPSDLTAAQVRTMLALVIGTNVEAWSAVLDLIAGLSPAADKVPYFSGASSAALMTVTTFIRTLLDDTDAAAARSTLGLAALAVLATVGTSQIDDDAVSNAKAANMATATLKGRSTAGTGDPEDLTASQVRTLLSLVIGTNVQAWSADPRRLGGVHQHQRRADREAVRLQLHRLHPELQQRLGPP
jgi:hypothetical protein